MIRCELGRFEEKLTELLSYPVEKGRIMLYGSSFFTRWGYTEAQKDMADSGFLLLNHGFGGSCADDLLYHYHRLVLPYAPAAVIFRTGVNDISNGYSANETGEVLDRLCTWIKQDLPDCKVAFIPIFDFPRPEWQTSHNIREKNRFNRFCINYARENGHGICDINDFFYKSGQVEGGEFKGVFDEDGLHLTPEGYAEFVPYFIAKLKELDL